MATEQPDQPENSTDRSTGSAADSVELAAWAFVLPFLAYMLIASRTPELTPASIDDVSVGWYFRLVIIEVIVTIALLLYWSRRILATFPFRIDVWGFVVGVIGVVAWIGLCGLQIEKQALEMIGLGDWLPDRPGFNPFAQITDTTVRSVFLFFRFTMLALMVPIIEELFLRGFLLRYIDESQSDWHRIKLSELGTKAIWAAAIYGVLTHPSEAIAAAVWFGMVSVLMLRTGKFWNCVVAHGVTNLLLGLYVIYYSAWQLW